MLALGHQHNLLPYVVLIVSALSVQELFVEIYSASQDDQVWPKYLNKLFNFFCNVTAAKLSHDVKITSGLSLGWAISAVPLFGILLR